MGSLAPGTADSLPAVPRELSWVQLSRQSRYRMQMKNLMQTLIPGTAGQLQASYWYANWNVTSNSQSNSCKMAPFVNKDLCKGGLNSFFSHFQMANTKEEELVINNGIWWITSKITDAQSWCTFHFIRNIRQTAMMGILKLKIIRHNHENDEKLQQHLL